MAQLMRNVIPGMLYSWTSSESPVHIPVPEKVVRASFGANHCVIISETDQLYSYGNGNYGKLGHGDVKEQTVPKLVEYFAKHKIPVVDAVCGEQHTIVLAQNGDVYSFGLGNKQDTFFRSIFRTNVSGLGHGNNLPENNPVPMKINGLTNIRGIASGKKFCTAFNEQGQVFNWGVGQYAAFGNGSNASSHTPFLNKHFAYLKQQQKIQVVKIKSCESCSIALTKNGKLYGWGSNQAGQLGIKSQTGLQMYQTVNFATEIVWDDCEKHQVVDFDLSIDNILLKLDNGKLYWAGNRINYKPQPIAYEGQVKLFAAGRKSYVIVTPDNQVIIKKKYIKMDTEISVQDDLQRQDAAKLFKLPSCQILAIGGEHQNRYAIVK